MRARVYLVRATILAAAGTAFAGYLSMVTLGTGQCAFAEPCPSFLGQPACFTGVVLFGLIAWISVTSLGARVEKAWPVLLDAILSGAGVVFASVMTASEMRGQTHFRLGLPTCAYGLVFFIALFVVSVVALAGRGRARAGGQPVHG